MENGPQISQPTKQFGEKKERVEYKPRPGVYAVVTNNENKLAVVEYKGKYFLLGGGLDEGESVETGLKREIEEEVGMKILKSNFVGKANQYVVASDGSFNKEGSFYKVELDTANAVSGEIDHKFKWVSREEFKQNAGQELQVFAVENFK